MITHNVRHRLSKALCISMAIVYGWCSSISPARAFAPVAVLAAPQIVTAGASYAVAALAGIVGVIGMYLTIKDAADNEVAIPLGENEHNAIPAPAAGPTTAATVTRLAYIGNDLDWSKSYGSTVEMRCSGVSFLLVGQTTGSWTYTGGSASVVNGECQWKTYAKEGNGDPVLFQLGTFATFSEDGTQLGCGDGYTLSGSNCILSNPRKAADDKRCDLLLQNGQFSTADDMNCSDTVDGSKAAPLIRDGKAIVIGKNSSGQPVIVTVAPNSTVNNRDWVEVTIQEQVQTETETQIKTTKTTIDPQTSAVTSVSTSTKPGSMTLPSGGTVPTTSPDTGTDTTPDTSTEPDVTINTCGLPGQPACAIDDTGFASQGRPWEVQPEGPTLNDIKDKITNAEAPSFGWDWLPSILPGQSVQCHPLEFTGTITAGPAAGLTASEPLDLCPYFDYIRLFLGFLFGAGTVMYIWKRFTGAKTASAWEE